MGWRRVCIFGGRRGETPAQNARFWATGAQTRHGAAWQNRRMDKALLQALRTRRASIRRDWAVLLRGEPVTTALGDPDTLSLMIDRTLDDLFAALARRKAPAEAPSRSYDSVRHECACGRNPLLAYFLAGRQAFLDNLVLTQAESPDLDAERNRRAVDRVYDAVHALARREVSVFCALCRYRTDPPPPAGGDAGAEPAGP